MAARPVPPLSVHQPALALGEAGRLAARKLWGSVRFMAVMEEDGPVTLIVSWPGPFPPPVGTMTLRAEQLTPGRVVPQVIATLPVNPPLGVTVMVDVPVAPAVAVAAVPAMVKLHAVQTEPLKVKLSTLLPPKATGLGSVCPNELTIMK